MELLFPLTVHFLMNDIPFQCSILPHLFQYTVRMKKRAQLKCLLKCSYYAFRLFPLAFVVLYIFFVHVIGLQSEKAQSPPQWDLPSPTEIYCDIVDLAAG